MTDMRCKSNTGLVDYFNVEKIILKEANEMKRSILSQFMVLFTVILMVVLLPGLGQAGTKKHVLKIATVIYPAPSPHTDSIHRIGEKVTKATNGRITFKFYGNELCDMAELNELVMRGAMDMELNGMGATYDPRWNIIWSPYIAKTYEEAGEIYGPGGFMSDIFTTLANDSGRVWLGAWIQGFTGVSLSTRGATTPEEANGLKIRVPPLASFKCYWKALGFSPVLLPYSEIATAIATGIIDGQAGGGPFQTWNLCRDMNKFFVWYRDFVELWGYTINKKKWDDIEADDQMIIQKVVDEEVMLRLKSGETEQLKYMKKLEDYGLTVIDLADYPKKLEAAAVASRNCWKVMDPIVGKLLMDKLRKAVGMEVE